MGNSKSFVVSIFIIICVACSRDMVEPVTIDCTESFTYENQVKDIIDVSCAYAGCHIAGFPSGDFSNYTSLKSITEGEELFKKRVLDQMNMPPSYATAGPTELTAEEKAILQCWFQDGYPEN